MNWIVDLLLVLPIVIGIMWGVNSGLHNATFGKLGVLAGWWLTEWFPYLLGMNTMTEAIVWVVWLMVERYADDAILFLESVAILESRNASCGLIPCHYDIGCCGDC